MIGDLGAPELLVIFAIVVVLFGVGKIGRLGKDLGSAVREFRKAVHEDDEATPVAPVSESTTLKAPETPAAQQGANGERRPPAIF